MWKDAADYVASLGLDAYVVGGAVRDELLGRPSPDQDFLVAGVGHEGLRAALRPHGKIEELEVAGQLVGVRFFPHDPQARRLAPAGIELAPPRAERSTGPGRHDFVIVADASIPVEEDLRRRDFTVNAIARHLATGALVDPFGGEDDLRRGVLRTVTPRGFSEDPLRLVRALRFVSQLGLEPDEGTLAQMREHAAGVRLVSGERVGGGLHADGLGELSKLLLGSRPARALRLARDTGVLAELLPELAPSIGFDQESRYHARAVDEHTFEAVQASADAGHGLAVRLALLFHDAGKPASSWRGKDGRLHYYAKPELGKRSHEAIGAELAAGALERLRYPTRLRTHVVRLVREHMFSTQGNLDAARARKFLARHGEELALDLLDHKEADLRGKPSPPGDLEALARFRRLVLAERTSPHRLRDLAVDGDDLIELGFRPGPALGKALAALLQNVVADPSLNERERLLALARKLL